MTVMAEQSVDERVLVKFHCPRCVAPNSVHLVALSKAGSMDCSKCGRRLTSSDVMRALINLRRVEGARQAA